MEAHRRMEFNGDSGLAMFVGGGPAVLWSSRRLASRAGSLVAESCSSEAEGEQIAGTTSG
jgi:hypothetical protein